MPGSSNYNVRFDTNLVSIFLSIELTTPWIARMQESFTTKIQISLPETIQQLNLNISSFPRFEDLDMQCSMLSCIETISWILAMSWIWNHEIICDMSSNELTILTWVLMSLRELAVSTSSSWIELQSWSGRCQPARNTEERPPVYVSGKFCHASSARWGRIGANEDNIPLAMAAKTVWHDLQAAHATPWTSITCYTHSSVLYKYYEELWGRKWTAHQILECSEYIVYLTPDLTRNWWVPKRKPWPRGGEF